MYDDVVKICEADLAGETACLSLDGWSNVHSEPIIAVSLSSQGKTYIIDSIDSEPIHSGDKLRIIMESSIEKAKKNFKCSTGSVVTDNASNMAKMRRELQMSELAVTYGCSAHIMNLLAKDIERSELRKIIVKIIKYLHKHQLPACL